MWARITNSRIPWSIFAVFAIGIFFLLIGIYLALPSSPAPLPTIPQPPPEVLTTIWEGDVIPSRPWTQIGLNVKPGDRLFVRTSGKVHWADDTNPGEGDVGPRGTSFPAREIQGQPYQFPYQNTGCGALLLRIKKRVYAVGSESVVIAREGGYVEFAINDKPQYLFENTGSFHVIITSPPTQTQPSIAPSESPEEVRDLIAEQTLNEHERTNDCDCDKLPREEFGVDRWRMTIRKVGHWCIKGIRVKGNQELRVQGPDYQDFQVLYFGKVYTARTDWRSIFEPDRGTDTVYFSATHPMTITITVSE